MCGIAGIYNSQKLDPTAVDIIKQMNQLQKHRGPDDEGVLAKPKCILGHRRLSIIDLSSDGHQPFVSEDGRYSLVYNGEIYNYIELRSELQRAGWHFRTKTDTEVLLKAFQAYGKDCLSKFNGMFAFAIYDSVDENLFLARDRVGVKPLYYCWIDGTFYFASEIKAFKAIPQMKRTLNEQSVFDYFLFNRKNLFDGTFINEIQAFPKGHYAYLDRNGLALHLWWDPETFLGNKVEYTRGEVNSRIEEILVSSVQLRMRSDVVVGSCLSGGLDSSIILGILFQQGLAQDSYATFTAAFPGESIDETKYVDDFQKIYPFQNFRTFPSSEGAFNNLEQFVYAQDEPTLAPTYYAQYEVMRLAKKRGVTVLLDGQGGDENFAGYPYMNGFYLYGQFRQGNYLHGLCSLASTLMFQQDRLAYQTFLFRVLPDALKIRTLKNRVPFFSEGFFNKYLRQSLVFNKFLMAENLNDSLCRHFQYKLEHLLHSEDRNSMAFSIEARVPYLDYRLIEFLLGVKEDWKVDGGVMKYLQKKALGHYTSSAILSRKDKIGFDAPTEKWMSSAPWQDLSRASYEDVLSRWPGLFENSDRLWRDPGYAWKMIQLSTWAKAFLN